MNSDPAWLPSIIEFTSDWSSFEDTVYKKFCADFVDHYVFFEGRRVSVQRHPESHGKGFGFWHCVSEGRDDLTRVPDLERCKRIRWIRAIIENSDDQSIDVWSNYRGKDKRRLLWFREHYLVVLAERSDYYLLKTAYLTTRNHTVRKLRAERDQFLNG